MPPSSLHTMLPQPAPTDTMSNRGVRTGRPSIVDWPVSSGSPAWMRHTSVLVPPMSKVMRLANPDCTDWRTAPMTPAAGPENSAVTGLRRMPVLGRRPPLDCMRLKLPEKPRDARWRSNRSRYSEITGCTWAAMTVVEARSYSLNSGAVADEQVRTTCWSRRPTRSASARSCAGLA